MRANGPGCKGLSYYSLLGEIVSNWVLPTGWHLLGSLDISIDVKLYIPFK